MKFLEEQMLKRIFEEGLATQKNRLRELRSYAQGKIFLDFGHVNYGLLPGFMGFIRTFRNACRGE